MSCCAVMNDLFISPKPIFCSSKSVVYYIQSYKKQAFDTVYWILLIVLHFFLFFFFMLVYFMEIVLLGDCISQVHGVLRFCHCIDCIGVSRPWHCFCSVPDMASQYCRYLAVSLARVCTLDDSTTFPNVTTRNIQTKLAGLGRQPSTLENPWQWFAVLGSN